MKFVKRHKYTIILLIIFLLLVVLGTKAIEILMPDDNAATYGDRLKDIENHPIDEEIFTKIDDEFGETKKVKMLSRRLQGKILNFYITVNDDVSVKDAKALGDKLVTYFDEDMLSYYSIQVYLIKEDESLNNFPIIGMKDPLSKVLVWTKDREIVKSDENNEN